MKEVPHTELEYDKIVSLVTAHVLSHFSRQPFVPNQKVQLSISDRSIPASVSRIPVLCSLARKYNFL